jgi:DNA-binding NtrC family response regulator
VRRLTSYAWPGNIRELESVVSRALLEARGPVIDARDLGLPEAMPRKGPARRIQTLAEAERQHIKAVLEAHDWNKRRAAEALGVGRGTLYRKIEEYGLKPS